MRWRARLAAIALSTAALLAPPPVYAQRTEDAHSEARAWVNAAKSRWSAILVLLTTYRNTVDSIALSHMVGKMSDGEARAAIIAARSRFSESAAAIREIIGSAGPAPNLAPLGVDNANAQALLDSISEDQSRAVDRLTALVAFLEEIELAASIEARLDREAAHKLSLHSYFREQDRLLAEALRSECIEVRRDSPADLMWRAGSISLQASSIEHAARVVVLQGQGPEELPRLSAEVTSQVTALRNMLPTLRAARPEMGDRIVPMPGMEQSLQPHVVFRVLPDAVSRFADELEQRPAYWTGLTRDEILREQFRPWPDLMKHVLELAESPT
jgi:hypothetical protein